MQYITRSRAVRGAFGAVLRCAAVSRWTLFFAALGLAVFIEGLPYFVSPSAVRRYLEQLQKTSDATLRTLGFVLMVAGLAVAYASLH